MKQRKNNSLCARLKALQVVGHS